MIKHWTSALLLLILFAGCNGDRLSSNVVNNPNSASVDAKSEQPHIDFEKSEHNFGKMVVGEVVSYRFKFTNTGKSDLLITEVKASCGCTTPKYPKKPIQPGKSDYITVSFNSKGRKGYQSKQVVVVSNAQPSVNTLRIKANVVQPEQ